ncbi:MAG: ECF transporter S component [Dictyoglomus turgidum]|uniref:Riboflavin transporter n=1 Tax=Dictyoglomus turgidum (strain DSM 6724 / Z-1310) TaxID=515635 RepID=B8E048_DICTD|nr:MULTISPECIES: ECF transporter S component [Dictyoglomus]ACK42131.1 riboflavin transporter [Dictyoglomus turgidum DSM 6724]HBU32362.1 ECF transporter S component [Dictyoglomus sp.]
MGTKKLVFVSILTALSIILSITIYFPILPQAPYLLYDPGDIPLILISTQVGISHGILATLIVAILMAVLTGQGGPIGALMHFLASGTLIVVSGYVYTKTKNLILGLTFGTISMAIVMAVANIIFTPIYLGVPRNTIYPLIFPVIIPFNLIKAGINSIITYILLSISLIRTYFEKMKG